MDREVILRRGVQVSGATNDGPVTPRSTGRQVPRGGHDKWRPFEVSGDSSVGGVIVYQVDAYVSEYRYWFGTADPDTGRNLATCK